MRVETGRCHVPHGPPVKRPLQTLARGGSSAPRTWAAAACSVNTRPPAEGSWGRRSLPSGVGLQPLHGLQAGGSPPPKSFLEAPFQGPSSVPICTGCLMRAPPSPELKALRGLAPKDHAARGRRPTWQRSPAPAARAQRETRPHARRCRPASRWSAWAPPAEPGGAATQPPTRAAPAPWAPLTRAARQCATPTCPPAEALETGADSGQREHPNSLRNTEGTPSPVSGDGLPRGRQPPGNWPPAWRGPGLTRHRGSRCLWPENTPPAPPARATEPTPLLPLYLPRGARQAQARSLGLGIRQRIGPPGARPLPSRSARSPSSGSLAPRPCAVHACALGTPSRARWEPGPPQNHPESLLLSSLRTHSVTTGDHPHAQ